MNTSSPIRINRFSAFSPRKSWPVWARVAFALGALLIAAILVWQGFTAQGVPDPTQKETTFSSAILDIGVLVFREGLECILVLSAITASMTGALQVHRRPVLMGAGLGFVGTVITWFIAVSILNSLANNVSALNLQAATGLVAIVVLLVVMNWFFHKMYWGGWICAHNRKKKSLLTEAGSERISAFRLSLGLAFLGFSSFYREGFEVVLFLQGYRLKLGSDVVMFGTLCGGVLTCVAAVLTFVAHRRLPYRRMLVLTGIMLGAVLLVMVGEQVQEMQAAHWISSTNLPTLSRFIPEWMGLWLGIFPNVETLAAQAFAALAVVGSFFAAGRVQQTVPECTPAGKGACPPNCP